MNKNSFRARLQTRYQVKSDNEDNKKIIDFEDGGESEKETDLQSGSSHPDNWQTDIQNGKSAEELRQDAIALSQILQDWQSQILQAQDYYKEMTANSDKYLHMFNPILIKGLSREKLEGVAEICQKFATLATIV